MKQSCSGFLAFLFLELEEVVVLLLFLLHIVFGEDGTESVGVEAGIEHLGGGGHGRRGEVLHLLKPVAHLAHDAGEMLHVTLGTAGMGGDKIRYELLTEATLAVYLVENAAELAEELK